jgi:hypothetical protein
VSIQDDLNISEFIEEIVKESQVQNKEENEQGDMKLLGKQRKNINKKS